MIRLTLYEVQVDDSEQAGTVPASASIDGAGMTRDLHYRANRSVRYGG